jgi:hypothetical protein
VRTIAIDFDGVIHGYESGWTGPVPGDPPVPGAREGIAGIRALGFQVVVFTCRALTDEGRRGIVGWLAQHGIEVDEVTAIKPHAELYVDDRAWRFEGDWSELLEDLQRFGVRPPWNRDRQPAVAVALESRPPTCATCGVVVSAVTALGTYTACGHPIPGAEAVS